MLTGSVAPSLEAHLSITVHGPGGQVTATAVIDTGFTSALALPLELVGQLQLPQLGSTRVVLADGSEAAADDYQAEVDWGPVRAGVRVVALGDVPLVGLPLLHGYRLTIDVRAGGDVTIEPIPTG
jgi:clan AA aspartic protease